MVLVEIFLFDVCEMLAIWRHISWRLNSEDSKRNLQKFKAIYSLYIVAWLFNVAKGWKLCIELTFNNDQNYLLR